MYDLEVGLMCFLLVVLGGSLQSRDGGKLSIG